MRDRGHLAASLRRLESAGNFFVFAKYDGVQIDGGPEVLWVGYPWDGSGTLQVTAFRNVTVYGSAYVSSCVAAESHGAAGSWRAFVPH